jgi:hypothetical protein
VSGFWKRHDSGLEGELRRRRAEPSKEFVASVAERVRPQRERRGLRVGVAVALTIAMLAALAPIGAASYAGSAALRVVSAASHALGPTATARKSARNSPARDQYQKPKKKKKKKPPARKAKRAGRAGVRARRGPHFTG